MYEDRSTFDLLYVSGGLGAVALMDRAIDDLKTWGDERPLASALDLGLYLVETFWGAEARAAIANQMEYRGYSPL
jgi:hypothetical protein